jgi:HK97 family phage prohead protease/HK97 family phage major capsid protein
MKEIVYRTARQSERDPSEYVLSDETVDRYGEIILAAGWDLSSFKKNPIALFNHHSDAIVGTWENVRVEGRRLIGRLKLAEEGTSQLVDNIRRLWKQGILKAVSVGFRPIDKEPIDKDAGSWGPYRYLKSELVECSLVAVPANPNALQIGRSLALPADVSRQLYGKIAAPELDGEGGSPGKIAKPQLPASGRKSMKLADRIKAAQTTLNDLRDRLTVLTGMEELDEAEQIELEELARGEDGRIAVAQKQLVTLQSAERALALTTANSRDSEEPQPQLQQPQRQAPADQKRPFAMAKKKVEPGDFLVRAGVVHFLARMRQQNPLEAMQAVYGNDEMTEVVLRAVTNPANTTTPGWAAELVQQANLDFIDRLMPESIYTRLSNLGVRFSFGANASLKIPARANTPKLAGSWVGEGAPKPVRRIGLTTITLTPKKLAVISTFTEELAMHSVPAIEAVIRQAMADDTMESIDSYLLDDVAGSVVRPAGLLNGVTPLTPDANPSGPLAMIADFKALVGAITANGGGRNIAIIMNPVQSMGVNWAQSSTGEFIFNQAEAAQRLNVTFLVSNTVPADTVIAVDAADFASANGDTPRFSISDQATIHEEDTTPAPLVTGGATPATASPIRSLWQTDTVGVRMTLYVEWAMRRAGMIAAVQGVNW